MKENPATFFKAEFKGITFAEVKVKPSTAAKAILLVLGITTAAIGGKYMADFLDDTLKPTYVINGQSNSIIDEPQEWVRPTDWKKK
jgi:hypothetical protein